MSKTCSESDDTAIDASVSGAEIFFCNLGQNGREESQDGGGLISVL